MLETVISNIDIKNHFDSGKQIHIECPHCKAQYMPGEVFMPGALIGKPVEVVKDPLGKIVYVDYLNADNMPNRVERFTCEYCNKPFEVEASLITYKTRDVPAETDFDTEYVPLI
jgi:hypothetical protein